MATLLVKSLGVVGSIVGISATGGGIYYLTSSNPATKETVLSIPTESFEPATNPKTTPIKNKSIQDLLEGKKLLTKSELEKGKWDAPGKLFKEAYPSETPPTPGQFNNGTQNKENPESLESFKDQCIKLGKEQVSGKDDETYVLVEKYCTTTKDTGDA